METERQDFYYELSDERLIAYSRLSLLERLQWLDELRCFTLTVRAAPTVTPQPESAPDVALTALPDSEPA